MGSGGGKGEKGMSKRITKCSEKYLIETFAFERSPAPSDPSFLVCLSLVLQSQIVCWFGRQHCSMVGSMNSGARGPGPVPASHLLSRCISSAVGASLPGG